MKKKQHAPQKQRNPVARATRSMHRGGAHGKTSKAERRATKVATEKLKDEERNRYVVEYSLAHDHVVQVGVIAKDEAAALRLAETKFDNGTIWDDTADCPLLHDDFEERDGNILEFRIAKVVSRQSTTVDRWPDADASVIQLRREKAAMRAARLLVEAYQRGEESGSVDWEDIDLAYEIALQAIEPAKS